MKLCRVAETVKVQAKELVSDSCKVDAVNKNAYRVNKKSAASEIKQQSKSPVNRDSKEKTCGHCSTQHPPKKCPAYGKTCNNCNKSNHYARCCGNHTPKQSKVHIVDEDDTEELYVDAVTENKVKKKGLDDNTQSE